MACGTGVVMKTIEDAGSSVMAPRGGFPAAAIPATDAACRFLCCDVPIVAGAMTHVSDAALAAAVSQAGGFGFVAAGGRTPDGLAAEIVRARSLTDRAFGVNLVNVDPAYEEQLRVCLDLGVTHVALGGGIPNRAHVERLIAAGRRVVGFAPNAALGLRLLRSGVGALVVEGHEAGGHVGPVCLGVLMQEMEPLMERGAVVIAAGGIATGRAVAGHLLAGAGACQLGTRFLCAEESPAHPAAKAAIVAAAAREAVVSQGIDPRLRVIPVRALANRATSDFLDMQRRTLADLESGDLPREEASARVETFWSGRLRRAMREGDVETGSLMAGQSVGMVRAVEPAAAIVADLAGRAAHAVARAAA
jgi:enoyl-[acyl-carrier protein] reductase II